MATPRSWIVGDIEYATREGNGRLPLYAFFFERERTFEAVAQIMQHTSQDLVFSRQLWFDLRKPRMRKSAQAARLEWQRLHGTETPIRAAYAGSTFDGRWYHVYRIHRTGHEPGTVRVYFDVPDLAWDMIETTVQAELRAHCPTCSRRFHFSGRFYIDRGVMTNVTEGLIDYSAGGGGGAEGGC